MAENTPQNFANHTRFHPVFHFFLIPVFLITLVAAGRNLVMDPTWHSFFLVVLAAAALLAVFQMRLYALKAQDRIIRLEERVRLTSLLQEPLRSRIGELTLPQLIALRFASDGEVAGLVTRALNENLTSKDIKAAIQQWRPDYFRV